MGDDQAHQPKSVIEHSVDYASNIQRHLGVINYDIAYGNFFDGAGLGYELTYLIDEAIKQKNIDLKNHSELIPNKNVIYELRKIWVGQCYLTIERIANSDKIRSEKFHYDKTKIDFMNPNLEIIPIPALQNMRPVRPKKEETLLVQISESMSIKHAWQGLDYDVIVNDGKYYTKFTEETIPRFKRDDLEKLNKMTSRISRDVYNKLIKKEKNKFIQKWSVIHNNYHKIIEYLKLNDDEDYEIHTTKTTKKLVQ